LSVRSDGNVWPALGIQHCSLYTVVSENVDIGTRTTQFGR
jgi:hypothetical protein